MPIYEYQCAGCSHHFDVIQKINDEPIKTCPQCAKNLVVRQVSAPGFQLKGSGWYATDFKNKGKEKVSKSDAPSEEKPSEKNSVEATPVSTTTKDESA